MIIRRFLSAALLLLGTGSLRGNLIVNGSFEANPVAPGLYSTVTPTGWSLLGNGSVVDIISAGYGAGSVASDGAQFLDLIGGGVGTLPCGIRQSVSLVGGTAYSFSFDYNGDYSSRVLDYAISGVLSGSLSASALNVYPVFGQVTPWQSFQTTFVAPATASYTIEFLTLSGTFESPFIDNVALNPTAVPDSGSTLLLCLGGAAAVLLSRPTRAEDVNFDR